MKRVVAAAAAAVTAAAALGVVVYKAYRYRQDAQYWHAEWRKLHQNPAGRDRFRADNARLRTDERARGRTVFLGASITESLDLRREFPREDFVNRGTRGQLVWQQFLRVGPDALDLNPDAVVIKMCAINLLPDAPSLDETQYYFGLMAEAIRRRGVKAILATAVPVSRAYDRDHGGQVTRQLVAFNAWVRTQAREHHDMLLDYASALSDDEGYLPDALSDDGLHPNEAGQRRMLATIRSTLIEGRVPAAPEPPQPVAEAPSQGGGEPTR